MENYVWKWLFLHDHQPFMGTYYLFYLGYEDGTKPGTLDEIMINNRP